MRSSCLRLQELQWCNLAILFQDNITLGSFNSKTGTCCVKYARKTTRSQFRPKSSQDQWFFQAAITYAAIGAPTPTDPLAADAPYPFRGPGTGPERRPAPHRTTKRRPTAGVFRRPAACNIFSGRRSLGGRNIFRAKNTHRSCYLSASAPRGDTNSTQLNSTQQRTTDAGVWHL